MKTATPEQEYLAGRGWLVLSDLDLCWLDCARPGTCRRTWRGRDIVLCLRHACDLEAGAYLGDYSAAPLPPDSFATAWPWMLLDD